MRSIPDPLRGLLGSPELSILLKEFFMSSAAAPKPSPELIFGSLISYQHAFALKAAIELDLFTAIAEGATDAAAIAKRVNAAERGVRILADGMTVQGFLRKENGKYSLSQDSALPGQALACLHGRHGRIFGERRKYRQFLSVHRLRPQRRHGQQHRG
jgi:hypothetical protein